MPRLYPDDLTTDELRDIAIRIRRALAERPALLISGLQYRLGEVGQSRVHPRALLRALEEIANNARPRRGQVSPGVIVPKPGVAALPDLKADPAGSRGEAAVALARGVAASAGESALDALTRVVSAAILGAPRDASWSAPEGELGPGVRAPWDARGAYRYAGPDPVVGDPQSREGHGSGRDGVMPGRVLQVPAAGPLPPVWVWVTNALAWLAPDDPGLWDLLARAAAVGARFALVARVIDLQTFAVLKQVGAVGVQGLQWFIDAEPSDARVQDARMLYWPPLRAAHGARAVAVAAKLATLRGTSLTVVPAAEHLEAIAAADAVGLRDPARAGPAALLKWAARHDVRMHPHWTHALRRWCAWEAYRAPARLGRLPDA